MNNVQLIINPLSAAELPLDKFKTFNSLTKVCPYKKSKSFINKSKMNLEELCDLWKYQHTESRFTGYLKDRIEGYDNGRVYNIETAKRDR